LPLLILALSVQPSCRHLSGLIMKYISVKLNVQFLQVILILPCHKQTKRILANIFCNDKWNWLCICTKKEIKKSLLNPINTLLSILYSRQFAKEKNWDFDISNIYQNMYHSLFSLFGISYKTFAMESYECTFSS